MIGFNVINKKKLDELSKFLSFGGKKDLLTLAFDNRENIDSIIETIKKNQAIARSKSKIVNDLVRETFNFLTQVGSLPINGGILFSGYVRTSSGKKFFIDIVTPLVEGYEDYFRGATGTKFYIEPLENYIDNLQKNQIYSQKEMFKNIISEIEKERAKKSSKLIIGSAHVREAVKEGKARKVVMSTKLEDKITCTNCWALQMSDSESCSICNKKINTNAKTFLTEMKELCKKTNTEIIIFSDDIAQVLNEQYYSIACLLRF